MTVQPKGYEQIVKRLDKKIKQIESVLDRIPHPTVTEGRAVCTLMEELAILRGIRNG